MRGGFYCTLGQCRWLSFGTGSFLLKRAGGSKLFSHPNEIGERFCAHLLHDVRAMKFDRALGGGEFAGDLFVQQSGGNERHHFALTRGNWSLWWGNSPVSDRSFWADWSPLDAG